LRSLCDSVNVSVYVFLIAFLTGTVHLVGFSEKTSQSLAELQVFAPHSAPRISSICISLKSIKIMEKEQGKMEAIIALAKRRGFRFRNVRNAKGVGETACFSVEESRAKPVENRGFLK